MATFAAPPLFWDQVEPPPAGNQRDGRAPHSCYSKKLKVDLLPGTFVVLAATQENARDLVVVSRIVKAVHGENLEDATAESPCLIEVNIFRNIEELFGQRRHEGICDSYIKHLPEIVQTTEVGVVAMSDISNLAFVFKESSLQEEDGADLFSTCQGMGNAFILRYRMNNAAATEDDDNTPTTTSSRMKLLERMPSEYCLPFPSCYQNSGYHDCFARRVWNNLLRAKLEMTRLLGRYSQQQGLYGRERSRVSFSAEAWGFLCIQCTNIFCASDFRSSKRIRLHRVIDSGLVLKATRMQRSCVLLRFATKAELQCLCRIFGESTTAGQRCRLPKISTPKGLRINDLINVVQGSDLNEQPTTSFSARATSKDGIDLEFDGVCELYITIRYTRYSYTRSSLDVAGGCDPLLFCLICRKNPYKLELDENGALEEADEVGGDEDSVVTACSSVHLSDEFEDDEGYLYKVSSMTLTHVSATCLYPRRGNLMYGCEKLFDLALTKELINRRING